nr:EAL domain-containing protein [uncultured Cohaesibacter sp.]
MKKGKGFNSIPIRFAVMSLAISGLIALAFGLAFDLHFDLANPTGTFSPSALIALMIAFVILPTLITYVAARKLTTQISALKASTDAIANGKLYSPIDIECNCEIGGLADSFRGMVKKINSNVLRMNIIAYTDVVTNLPNRAVVAHILNQLAASDAPYECSVLFLDLDGFKRINDTYGHEAGDQILSQASKRIINEGLHCRRDDLDTCMTVFGELCTYLPKKAVVARYAGDEFVIILPGNHSEEARLQIAEEILAAFDRPFYAAGQSTSVGLSIGIASYPQDTCDANELIKFADLAMYASKRDKKRRITLFEPKFHEKVLQQARLERELKLAIDSDQIFLHFQPKLKISTGELFGVEALARWNHPKDGVIPPSEFIPVAEESGLIIPLGQKVFDLALQQSNEWLAEGKCKKISINIAPLQFDTDSFVNRIIDLLARHKIPPSFITVEITESMAMADFEASQAQLSKLRSAGISIAIDDFGTGFSNLSLLTRLPFDILKIDKSLISDIGFQPKSEAVLRAVVSMSKALNFETIAEGIETEEQFTFLENIGCDNVQGFLLGKPMSVIDLARWEKEFIPFGTQINKDIKKHA